MSAKLLPVFTDHIFPYNYDFQYTRDETPIACPEHRHTDFEFMYIQNEKAKLKVNETLISADRGDFVLIWPGEAHQYIQIPPRSCMMFKFRFTLINDLKDIKNNLTRLYKFHHIKADECDELCIALAKLVEKGFEYYTVADQYTRSETKAITAQFFTNLLRFYEKIMPAPENSLDYTTQSKIDMACNYIDTNFMQDISQKDVAQIVGFSHYYFSRIFKQYTLSSFADYLAQRRVEYAAELLQYTDIAVTDIALRSGFQSISSFNSCFKKLLKVAPTEYRKIMLKRVSQSYES